MICEKIAQEITVLRQRLLAASTGVRQPVSPPAFDAFWQESLSRYQSNHNWWSFHDSDGVLKAHFGFGSCFEKFFGQEIQRCLFHYDWDDRAATEWMKQCLRDNLPPAHSNSWILLPKAYRDLFPYFMEKGYGISDLNLGGFARDAQKRLREYYAHKPQVFLPDLGLQLEPIRDSGDIPAISALRMQIFSEQPERCWFYRNSGVQEEFEAFTLDRISNGRQWKILREGNLLGMFGYGFSPRTLFGKEAQMDFAVDLSLHRLGIGRLAYQIMLNQMQADEVDYFSGSTANPAVIHLGRVMGRPVERFELRALECCPPQEIFAEEIEMPMSSSQSLSCMQSVGDPNAF